MKAFNYYKNWKNYLFAYESFKKSLKIRLPYSQLYAIPWRRRHDLLTSIQIVSQLCFSRGGAVSLAQLHQVTGRESVRNQRLHKRFRPLCNSPVADCRVRRSFQLPVDCNQYVGRLAVTAATLMHICTGKM